MCFPFRFSFRLQNPSPAGRLEGRGSLTLSLPDAESGSQHGLPTECRTEPSPTAQPRDARALLASTAPAKRVLGVLCSQQPGTPARFGDVTAGLDLHGCAAAGRALTQQQTAPSRTLGVGLGGNRLPGPPGAANLQS